MAEFKYSDVEKALVLTGFKFVNSNAGSHQKFKMDELGFSQPMPLHAGDKISPGVAKSVLDWVILVARITSNNIAAKSSKLAPYIKEYIIRRHEEIKKNPVALIPDEIRKQFHIETKQAAQKYLDDNITRWQKIERAKNPTKTKKDDMKF